MKLPLDSHMVLPDSGGKIPAMKSATFFFKPKTFKMPGELQYEVIMSFSQQSLLPKGSKGRKGLIKEH